MRLIRRAILKEIDLLLFNLEALCENLNSDLMLGFFEDGLRIQLQNLEMTVVSEIFLPRKRFQIYTFCDDDDDDEASSHHHHQQKKTKIKTEKNTTMEKEEKEKTEDNDETAAEILYALDYNLLLEKLDVNRGGGGDSTNSFFTKSKKSGIFNRPDQYKNVYWDFSTTTTTSGGISLVLKNVLEDNESSLSLQQQQQRHNVKKRKHKEEVEESSRKNMELPSLVVAGGGGVLVAATAERAAAAISLKRLCPTSSEFLHLQQLPILSPSLINHHNNKTENSEETASSIQISMDGNEFNTLLRELSTISNQSQHKNIELAVRALSSPNDVSKDTNDNKCKYQFLGSCHGDRGRVQIKTRIYTLADIEVASKPVGLASVSSCQWQNNVILLQASPSGYSLLKNYPQNATTKTTATNTPTTTPLGKKPKGLPEDFWDTDSDYMQDFSCADATLETLRDVAVGASPWAGQTEKESRLPPRELYIWQEEYSARLLKFFSKLLIAGLPVSVSLGKEQPLVLQVVQDNFYTNMHIMYKQEKNYQVPQFFY